ncbi:MAG: SagB/ThcOx family dehydrogenase [Cyanobacteria bacterium J06597_1]
MIAVSPAYHEFTKYDPETIATLSRQLDWSQQPSPFKTYPIGHSLELKPYLSSPAVNPGNGERLLQRLSRLLHLSYGVTAIVPSERPIVLRSAPSAGGLYPAELYVLSKGRPGLPQGIYNYQALDHALLKYWDECDWSTLSSACFSHPLFAMAEVAIVLTAIFHRSEWRYEDRAYRRLCLDTGHLLGNIELAANMTGFRASLIGEFQDAPIERMLSLNEQQEGTLAILPLQNLLVNPSLQRYRLDRVGTGVDHPLELSTAQPKRGEWLQVLHQHTRITPNTINPDIVAPQRTWQACPPLPDTSSDSTTSEPANLSDKYNFPFCDRIEAQTVPISWGEMLQPLANTILHRRSTRQFTGGNIDIEHLRQLLDFAYQTEHYRAQGLDPQPDFLATSMIETFVVANGVDGLDDGCYYYAARAQQLRQIRFKSFRRDVHYLCLGQDLGRDAAAAIVHTADLKQAVRQYGDRGYRYLHMDAGHLGQRINLAAVRLKLGVSGIAGFFDNLVNEVLGIPSEEAVLYITTVGQPRRTA